MSSWANKGVSVKRNISQIPEHLRPNIIPRTARPEIIMSESFQEPIIDNKKNEPKKVYEQVTNPRQYVGKKIDSKPQPDAIELRFNDKSYVFVILRHLRTTRDNDLWISSYNSIRRYYTNKIVIIDDNSSINTVNGKLVNTEVIRSEFNGAGEILPYYYFLKFKWADRMIFLHDSMFLYRPFRDSELEGDIKFHWYFNSSEFRDDSKINLYLSLLRNNQDIVDFYSNPDSFWRGCFGVTSIADYSIIDFLENKYGLFSSLVLHIKTRKDREMFERLFGIVLFYEKLVNVNCSNFGLITDYPGAFESENNNLETAFHILQQRGYNTAIAKVWRGR